GTTSTVVPVAGTNGTDYVSPSVALNSATGNFVVVCQLGVYGQGNHALCSEVSFSPGAPAPRRSARGANLNQPTIRMRPDSGASLVPYTDQTANGIVGVLGTTLTPGGGKIAVFGRDQASGTVVALVPTSTTTAGADVWAHWDPTV